MKSTKCFQCGFVGWSDVENCKACGASLSQRSTSLPQAGSHHDSWNEPEGQKKGLAIAGLVLGILSFMTFGLLGVGAIVGIILSAVAMVRVSREPWRYGGRGLAIAGLVLSITSLVAAVPIGVVAAIAIPNLLASRRAANEGSAIRSLRLIAEAEFEYQSYFGKYGTLEELAAKGLIAPNLVSGTRHGYNFTLTLDSTNPNAFEVTGVPITYGSTGTRSFYVDETYIIRGEDHYGGPPTKMDTPLQ